MNSIHQWLPDSYDRKLGFVSGYGKDLIGLLEPAGHESILDLGCGTGDLTYEIAQCGASVTGMDSSRKMIEKAAAKFPGIRFILGDGQSFQTDAEYDAVFSNAALHWMKDAAQVAQGVWNALKPGGRLVAEFGGQGNVDTIIQAIGEVLAEDYGINADDRHPWYFPSIGEYSSLLEEQGFIVRLGHHFDRPTKLQDGEQGIEQWLANFAGDFFRGFTAEETAATCSRIRSIVAPKLWKDGSVYADYKRLRIIAYKPVFTE